MADQYNDTRHTAFIMLHIALEPPSWPRGLTDAERHLISLCARGLSTPQMADARNVQPRTISNQLSQLYRKLGVFDRHEMLALVFRSPTT